MRHVAAAALGAGLLLATGTTAFAGEAGPSCFGKGATIVKGERTNFIEGTPGNDVIWAGDGDDVVFGGRGRDRVCGAGGDDHVFGEDTFASSSERDLISGGPGRDEVSDEAEDNHSGPFDDADRLDGDGGKDVIFPDAGSDQLNGGADTDLVRFFYGPVDVALAAGTSFSADAREGDDTLSGIENVSGSLADDSLLGDDGANRLLGNSGPDFIDGGEGADEVDGGHGNERDGDVVAGVYGGAGNDLVKGGAGDDELFGEAGSDRLRGGEAEESATGDFGDGGPGDDDCAELEFFESCP